MLDFFFIYVGAALNFHFRFDFFFQNWGFRDYKVSRYLAGNRPRSLIIFRFPRTFFFKFWENGAAKRFSLFAGERLRSV